jgi:hypothetical protein
VYEGTYGKRVITITDVKEEKDGAKLVTTELVQADGKRTPYMVQRISSAGVFLVAEGGNNYAEPWCILKLPHREGQSWETRYRYVNQASDSVYQMTAGPFENVRVDAGEFTAARVDWSFGTPGSPLPYWYAHGVGLVRLSEGMKLTSFTLGKE